MVHASARGGKRKIGVFGGTFDPVHFGHIGIAETVLNELDLETVVFVVAADQWLRSTPPVADTDDRTTMTMLAVEEMVQMSVSEVDIVRGRSTYTVDTLADIRDWIGEPVELHLIVGADSAMTMDRWRDAGRIASLARVVVVGRPGLEFDGQSLAKSHPAHGAEYVEGPMIDVSATEIRGLVRAGKSIAGLVPDRVADWIKTQGLYR